MRPPNIREQYRNSRTKQFKVGNSSRIFYYTTLYQQVNETAEESTVKPVTMQLKEESRKRKDNESVRINSN